MIATFASSAALGLADGTSLARLEEAILAELSALAENGPTEVEMEAAAAQNEREWLSTLASVEERADEIGRLTTLYGDPEGINTQLDRLDAVTAEDVGRAASAWLRPDHRAVIAYPGDVGHPRTRQPDAGQPHAGRPVTDEGDL